RLGAHKRSLPLLRDEAASAASSEPAPPAAAPAPPLGSAPASKPLGRTEPRGVRYPFRFQKTGATPLLGPPDVGRALPPALRRTRVRMVYTSGFHPKPDMTFSPALSLGVISLDEYVDLRLEPDLDPNELAALVDAATAASPRGLAFRGAAKLEPGDPGLAKIIA